MDASKGRPKIIVGVDGSEASITALRTAASLAAPLDAIVEAWTCWDVPPGFGLYLVVGIEGFEYAARQQLEQALSAAFGGEQPAAVHGRLVRGKTADELIEGSRTAALLIVGRRGHAGLVLGSVSSACVSHAHCPVLVVHAQEKTAAEKTAPRKTAARKTAAGDDPGGGGHQRRVERQR